MPLSKKRDKARKKLERARAVVQPNSNLNSVQPNKIEELRKLISNPYKRPLDVVSPSVRNNPDLGKIDIPELDADGNVIPSYT